MFENLSELPIINFFRIIETGDLTHLSKNNIVDNADKAASHWEKLMFEFEALTGTGDYRMQLREDSEDTKSVNRVNALISLYYLNTLGGYDISGDLKYWNVSGKDATAVKFEILREKTRFDIESIERNKGKDVKRDFFDLWTAVENGLNRNIDVENCSVKKWISLCKSLEEKANHYKKLNNER